MKELSIKQKAKAYDKALDKAKKELDTCGSQDCVAARQIFRFFPELTESEDERIRKELIFYFQEEIPQCSIQEHADKMKEFIAWLEKQGEIIKEWSEMKINNIQTGLQEMVELKQKKTEYGEQKLILLALAALMMVGCIEVKSRTQEEKEILDIYNTTYYTPNGCEYYIYNNHHSGIPIHKQDCRVCKERRQKELEELVIKLKEK